MGGYRGKHLQGQDPREVGGCHKDDLNTLYLLTTLSILASHLAVTDSIQVRVCQWCGTESGEQHSDSDSGQALGSPPSVYPGNDQLISTNECVVKYLETKKQQTTDRQQHIYTLYIGPLSAANDNVSTQVPIDVSSCSEQGTVAGWGITTNTR